MNNTQLFLTALKALRSTLEAGAGQITTILELAERPNTEAEPAKCVHPVGARQSRAVMGHPTRFFCTACQTLVD